jgi:DeoR family transcriptional regulator, aga operon transcriptional repressor
VTTQTKSRAVRLLVEERRRRILELLDGQERATVEELVARFRVTAVTIRGDLDALADAGSLVRSHGGALKRLDQQDVPIAVKETLHHDEKVRIGHAAARLIREDETIILDSGTTTAEIARQLKFLKLKSLTVITNALNIAVELASLPHVRVIMIGGILRQMSSSTVGPQAEQMLRGLYADRLFLGVDGLDPEGGLSTHDVLEAQLNALMIKVSREVTAVADSSKFLRRTLSLIGGLHEIHRIITDDKVDQQIVASLRARSLEVMVV